MSKFSQNPIGKAFFIGLLAATLTPALASLASYAEAQTGAASTAKKPKRPQQREAYRAELSHLLETNAVSCEKDDDCDALGVGSMACGGPKEFLPVAKATLAKIQSAVHDLTATIAEMDQARNKETGTIGICLALSKPKLACSAGKCEAAK